MPDPLTPAATRRALDSDRQLAIIDVREPLEFSRGHIEESTLVPRRLLEFRLPAVVPNEHATVVLCDQQGERAPLDADWLASLGYEDVRYIEGGMDAWEDAGFETIEAQAGVYATAMNYPSKEFGEQVQADEDVPQLAPDELKTLLEDEDEDVLVADVRTPEEHRAMTIPGALNVEGVDLGLYAGALREEDQPVVVHCAGRTRSIIGTATLEKLGFENVYGLENGTMGWELAGHELEHGADRQVRPDDLDEEYRAELRTKAESLLEETDVSLLSLADFQAFRADDEHVVYSVDVRTLDEYEEGHIPDSLAIPGGQAIQTADEHFAVRNGTIVFISNGHIRSAITAYWFSEMGFPNVAVLEAGIEGWDAADRPLETGSEQIPPLQRAAVEAQVSSLSPAELDAQVGQGGPEIVDIDTSAHFENGHVPGANWVPRYHLEGWLEDNMGAADAPLVLTCRHGHFSTYAAAALQQRGYEDVRILAGGTRAWAESGRSLETGTEGMVFEPRDEVPKPYDQGQWAKRAYLDWEEAL